VMSKLSSVLTNVTKLKLCTILGFSSGDAEDSSLLEDSNYDL
jgi:hypothetical protein